MFGLYSAQITELDVALQTGIDIGDSCVQGRVEIYSCIEAFPPPSLLHDHHLPSCSFLHDGGMRSFLLFIGVKCNLFHICFSTLKHKSQVRD